MAEKPAKDTPAPEPTVTLSVEQVLELAQKLAAQNQLTPEAIADLAAGAATAAVQKTNRWWDEREYPHISAFNPEGEKDHPKPKVNGEVYWVGYQLHEAELTRDEVDLVNQLTPGDYHGGKWRVQDLEPRGSNRRRLLVLFPCTDRDQRAGLPSMVDMLREMVSEAARYAAVK